MPSKFEDGALKMLGSNFPKILLKLANKDLTYKMELQTESVTLKTDDLYRDYVIMTYENVIIHFEFQSTLPTEEDIARFSHYAITLYRIYGCPVETIVILSPEVKGELKTSFNLNKDNEFKVDVIQLKEFDGEEIINKFNNIIKEKNTPTEEELGQLMILPLTKPKKSLDEQILKGAKITNQLATIDKEKLLIIKKIYLLLSSKMLEKSPLRDRIKEELIMYNELVQEYGDDREEDGRKEGIKEGKEEIARNLIDLGQSEDFIVKVTGLSIDDLNQL